MPPSEPSNRKLGFRELLAPQAHTFSRGEGAPGGGGCGIREITCDTVLRKDLRIGYASRGLMPFPYCCVSARIPHQSAARTSHADSFSPGEAMVAAAPQQPLNCPHKLKFEMPGLGERPDLAYFLWKKRQNAKKVVDLLAFLGYNATE